MGKILCSNLLGCFFTVDKMRGKQKEATWYSFEAGVAGWSFLSRQAIILDNLSRPTAEYLSKYSIVHHLHYAWFVAYFPNLAKKSHKEGMRMFMMISEYPIPWSNPAIEWLVHVREIANCLPHCFLLLRSIHLSVIVVAITWLVQSFWLYFRNIQIQTLFSSPVFAPNGFYILFLDCRTANETCLSLVPKSLRICFFFFVWHSSK